MSSPVADAPPGNLVDRFAPGWLRPFARLARWDRPIGSWLLLWPCWWSATLAAIAADSPLPNLKHLALFAVGAIAMRGAGCTYNDIVDRHIDAKVERTRTRPIPSGQVGVPAALAFMVVQALVGFAVLVQFNSFAIGLGIASLLVVALYPFAKRITSWPQAVLGLAFSWGALMGWAAAFGRIEAPALLLYAAAILWTIGYDTIYAHQDREDDAVIGVRSTARLFGGYTRAALAGLYAGTLLCLLAAGVLADTGPLFLAGLVAGGLHLAWQVLRFDAADPALCLRLFRSNRDFGGVIFAGLLADALVGALGVL